jgi:hypothetical protein
MYESIRDDLIKRGYPVKRAKRIAAIIYNRRAKKNKKPRYVHRGYERNR